MKLIKYSAMKKMTVLLLFLSVLILSCENNNDFLNGKLKNLKGLDGCGWVIQLLDSTYLEPTNLNEFDIQLVEDLDIRFKYNDLHNLFSICMVGNIVYINEIEGVKRKDFDPNCDAEVIISKQEYINAPSDYLTINSASIPEDCLTISFSSSGCDGSSWVVKLIDSGAVAESSPCQRSLRLSLKNSELCDAVISKKISFDISKLQISGDNSVILHLNGESILYEY